VESIYGHDYFFGPDGFDYKTGMYGPRRKNISLCKYFWSVIYGILLVAPTTVIVKIDGDASYDATLGISTIFYVEAIFGVVLSVSQMNWWWFPVPWITTCIVVGAAIGSFMLKSKIDTWEASKPVKPYKPKEPSLFVETLKAKKSKVCPIIQWEDPSPTMKAPETSLSTAPATVEQTV